MRGVSIGRRALNGRQMGVITHPFSDSPMANEGSSDNTPRTLLPSQISASSRVRNYTRLVGVHPVLSSSHRMIGPSTSPGAAMPHLWTQSTTSGL